MKKQKNNPNLRSVFAELLETRQRKSLFDVFAADTRLAVPSSINPKDDNYDVKLGISTLINQLTDEYAGLTRDEDFLTILRRLGDLEIALLMARSILATSISIGEMKLKRGNSDRSYAFARAAFYSPDNVKNEIRVYLGSIDEIGKTLEELRRDPRFLDLCESTIVKEMNAQLQKQLVKLKG
jgi:hypothetical protein